MRLQPGELQREVITDVEVARLGTQPRRGHLPARPGTRSGDLLALGSGRQAAMVGVQHVAALGVRQHLDELGPRVGKEVARAVLVEPIQLGGGRAEDAAQDQAADTLGMRLRVGQRQRAAPRATKEHPTLNADELAQPLDVGDQVPGRILAQIGVRCAATAAALVKEDHAKALRIKQPPVPWRAAAAGATVQEDDRDPIGRADLFPIHTMHFGHSQHAAAAWLKLRKQGVGHRRGSCATGRDPSLPRLSAAATAPCPRHQGDAGRAGCAARHALRATTPAWQRAPPGALDARPRRDCARCCAAIGAGA